VLSAGLRGQLLEVVNAAKTQWSAADRVLNEAFVCGFSCSQFAADWGRKSLQ